MNLNIHYVHRYIVIIIVLTIASFLVSLPFYYKKKQQVITQKYEELHSFSQYKAKQFAIWYEGKLQEANFFSQLPDLEKEILQIVRGSKQDALFLKQMLLNITGQKRYESISVFNGNGDMIITTNSDCSFHQEGIISDVQTLFQKKEKIIKRFFFCEQCQQMYLDIISPVFDKSQQVIAVINFRALPAEKLLAVEDKIELGLNSLETVLCIKEGDSIRVVAPVNSENNPTFDVSLPVQKTERFIITDYNGNKVLGNIVRVAETPFYLIVKMNPKEVLSEFREQMVILYSSIVLSILLVSSFIIRFYYSRPNKIYRDLFLTKSELNRLRKENSAILGSINEAVITTNKKGGVKSMNSEAEKLTGWKAREARNKNIERVFPIQNDDNSEEFNRHFYESYSEYEENHLGKPMILISKRGKSIPVISNVVPVKNKMGNLIGYVIVFHDRTKEQLSHKLMQAKLDIAEFCVNNNFEDTFLFALNKICALTQSRFGFVHFFKGKQETLVYDFYFPWKIHSYDSSLKGDFYLTYKAYVWDVCIKRNKPLIRNYYSAMQNAKHHSDIFPEIERDLVIPVPGNEEAQAVLGLWNKTELYTITDLEVARFLADVTLSIAEEKKLKEELERSEGKYKCLFQNSVIQLIIENKTGRILDVNPAAVEFYGWSADEFKNMYFADISEFSHEEVSQKIKEAEKDEISRLFFSQRKKNGAIVHIECSNSKINICEQELLHFIIHDVTERKLAEKELIFAQKKAEESERLKSAFLATISHEIRTPLNSIIGFSEIINDSTSDENIIEFSNIIRKSGEDLVVIIDDIFDLVLVENSIVKLRPVEFSLDSLLTKLKKISNELLTRTEKSNVIKLICNTGVDILNQNIYADEGKIIQVMTNIIRNAVKYTERGSIKLGIEMINNDRLSISVEDSGIGIPEDRLTVIFESFRQADDSLARGYGGVGVGLAISNKIASLMNGEISVYSVYKKGSVFTFSLPVQTMIDAGIEPE